MLGPWEVELRGVVGVGLGCTEQPAANAAAVVVKNWRRFPSDIAFSPFYGHQTSTGEYIRHPDLFLQGCIRRAREKISFDEILPTCNHFAKHIWLCFENFQMLWWGF